ncbi:unnamed protein product [Cylicostephanus goldi]|uniref:G-protein coupled receptors family 1 profile domain-containing protein n=1 Tax=Cylicostephanus goldi TaxID=71465 RepID=A0A3P6SF59_CYLGO|nr:unnamed protein product [Cylicostephanus goldi]
MHKVLRRFYPQYDGYTGAIYGVRNVLEFGPMYTILHMTLPVTPIYIAIVILRSKIIKRLDKVESMSSNTKFVHRQLLKVLIYQALLPMLFLIAVISYVLEELNIYHHPLLEYCVFSTLTLIPMLSPLVSLHFVRPYSEWISRHLFKYGKKNAVEASDGYTQKHVPSSAILSASASNI